MGCCGYPVSQNKYMKEFNVVELQSTFYRIPRLATVKKWKENSSSNFIFMVKAFQGITHSGDSPTWKKSNIKPNQNYGEFKPTEEVYESWRATKQVCEALSAPIVIIQTPPTFKDTPNNQKNVESFFTTIERGGLLIGLEPRGWEKESILKICKTIDLIHVTDPFLSIPLYTLNDKIAYFRLHGSPPGRRMYSYRYSDDDLQTLKRIVKEMGTEQTFVMFNNATMYEDAKRFINKLLI